MTRKVGAWVMLLPQAKAPQRLWAMCREPGEVLDQTPLPRLGPPRIQMSTIQRWLAGKLFFLCLHIFARRRRLFKACHLPLQAISSLPGAQVSISPNSPESGTQQVLNKGWLTLRVSRGQG